MNFIFYFFKRKSVSERYRGSFRRSRDFSWFNMSWSRKTLKTGDRFSPVPCSLLFSSSLQATQVRREATVVPRQYIGLYLMFCSVWNCLAFHLSVQKSPFIVMPSSTTACTCIFTNSCSRFPSMSIFRPKGLTADTMT